MKKVTIKDIMPIEGFEDFDFMVEWAKLDDTKVLYMIFRSGFTFDPISGFCYFVNGYQSLKGKFPCNILFKYGKGSEPDKVHIINIEK